MRYTLEGLDCANCAAKIERELQKIPGLENVKVNFATKKIELPEGLFTVAQETIARLEPEVSLRKDQDDGDASSKEVPLPLLVSALLFLLGFIFNEQLHNTPFSWLEYLVLLSSYALVGWPVITRALRNLVRGNVFDENFLMTLATAGAIAIHQLPEAAGVMLFYAVGEYFQEKAVNRSRRSIQALLNIQPEYANFKENGTTRRVRPDEVAVGQTIVVKPGERVPLDGEVAAGTSFVDTSALTGETTPRKLEPGDPILAGMVNGEGLLTVTVTKPYEDSSVARILDLVEKAGERKAPTEQYITAFARYYTPLVVAAAVLIAVVPPLLIPGATFNDWLYRALVLLVISCPCALVVSIPLVYFGGIGGASRHGILVKGANYLDALADAHTVVFDKTGTLTKGVFRVTEVTARNGFTPEEVLTAAAWAEVFSNHPIAHSLREAYDRAIPTDLVHDYREIPAHGISAVVAGKHVLAGNDRLMHREAIDHEDCEVQGTVVYVAVEREYAGYIVIADELREDAKAAVEGLKALGVQKVLMLTGDDTTVAARVAAQLEVDDFKAELLPEDKVTCLEEFMAGLPNRKQQKLVFVGDGVNDAPVITRADIGVAMGGLGSDAAIEAADVVLLEDAPAKLVRAIEIARWTKKLIRQNIALALAVKTFFFIQGSFGVASIWEAVFADVGVTLLAVMNASRTLRFGRRHHQHQTTASAYH
ncbi:MAG: cadmium-translocating P-type ATPase [Firmicutes bacterium]|nr:cadmium-translocating P-type ATPase [Bacillota bacterium]